MRDLEVGELVNGNAVVVGSFPSGSPEWHAERAGRLGGSEVASLVGLSPWTSRFSLYYQKKQGLGAVEETQVMRWGTNLEDAIYEHFKTTDGTFGVGLEQYMPGCTMTTGYTFRDLHRPWMNANPDGLIWDADGNCVGVLEIKTSARGDGWGPQGSKQIPVYYLCQVIWYAAVMRIQKIFVAVLISGWDYRTYELDFSESDAQLLIDAGEQFMSDLENNVEPNLDSHMSTYEIIREMHPDIERGEGITLDPDTAARYMLAVDLKKKYDDLKREVEIEVLHQAGNAQYVYVEQPGEGEYDVELVKIARRQPAPRSSTPYLRYLGLEEPYPDSLAEAIERRRALLPGS